MGLIVTIYLGLKLLTLLGHERPTYAQLGGVWVVHACMGMSMVLQGCTRIRHFQFCQECDEPIGSPSSSVSRNIGVHMGPPIHGNSQIPGEICFRPKVHPSFMV